MLSVNAKAPLAVADVAVKVGGIRVTCTIACAELSFGFAEWLQCLSGWNRLHLPINLCRSVSGVDAPPAPINGRWRGSDLRRRAEDGMTAIGYVKRPQFGYGATGIEPPSRWRPRGPVESTVDVLTVAGSGADRTASPRHHWA